MYYLNKPKRFVAGIADLEADEVVAGAAVTLENLADGTVVAAETDEFGDFWFDQVAAAPYRVYVEAEGYLSRMVETDATGEDRNIGVVELFKNQIGNEFSACRLRAAGLLDPGIFRDRRTV